MEEQWRRNEANIRRKAAGPNPLSSAALSDTDTPKSPANTGAMDDLLKKLRDAKPEARDQRDRRRRARLKDRHQVRVASGQKIPEIGVNMEAEEDDGASDAGKGLLSPMSETESVQSASVTSPTDTSAGGDVADRAAAMLEGLQGGSALAKDGSLVIRRRRENADNEREKRRRRRQQASTTSTAPSEDAGGLMSPSIQEDGDDPIRRGSVVSGDGSEEGPPTPITVVCPPSPEQKEEEGRKLPTPPPDA